MAVILSDGALKFTRDADGDPCVAFFVVGDEEFRATIDRKGVVRLGDGASPPTLAIQRTAAGGIDVGGPLSWGGGSPIDNSDLAGGGGGGEINVGQNDNTAGVGVFDRKVGTTLFFRGVAPASSKVSVALEDTENEVRIDVVESQIQHDNLAGFLADEHLDWTQDLSATKLVHLNNVPVMGPASAGAAGAKGLVPQPVIGDQTRFLRGDGQWADPPGGGGGEANTGSNTNTAGVGVYDGMNGTVLEFRGITAASSRVSVTLEDNEHEIRVDVVEANLSIAGEQIGSGTLADARLSSNVALRAVDNNFSAAQTFQQNIVGQADIVVTGVTRKPVNTADMFITGGNSGSAGARVRMFGGAHPTLAGQLHTFSDLFLFRNHADDATLGILNANGLVWGGGGDLLAKSVDWVASQPTDSIHLDNVDVMVGASAGAAGLKGLAPTPLAGEEGRFLRGDGQWADPPGAGGGEINVGQNDNTDGIGVFDRKVGTTLFFRGVRAMSSRLSATLEDTENEIRIDVVEGQIQHDNLAGHDPDQHLDWTQDLSASKLIHRNNVPVMGPASAGAAGAKGLVPQPVIGDQTRFLRGDGQWADPPGGGGGEANTGSNTNTAGVGVYDGMNGTVLEFRGITAASSRVSVTLEDTENEIRVDVVEGQLQHDNLAGIDPDQHLDWTQDLSASKLVHRSNVPVMGAASAGADGAVGLVPQPLAGDHVAFLRGDGQWALPVDTGEANTGSNANTAGVGVYDGMNGTALEFRGVAPGSSRVSVSLEDTENEIRVDVVEANLAIATSQLTGTLPNALVTAANVTQHIDAIKPLEHIVVKLGNETDDITTGKKSSFRMGYGFVIESVRAELDTPATGSSVVFDVQEGGVSIFSTKVSIDAGSETSVSAGVPAVISDPNIADNGKLTFHIDQIGSGTAGVGPAIVLIGRRA